MIYIKNNYTESDTGNIITGGFVTENNWSDAERNSEFGVGNWKTVSARPSELHTYNDSTGWTITHKKAKCIQFDLKTGYVHGILDDYIYKDSDLTDMTTKQGIVPVSQHYSLSGVKVGNHLSISGNTISYIDAVHNRVSALESQVFMLNNAKCRGFHAIGVHNNSWNFNFTTETQNGITVSTDQTGNILISVKDKGLYKILLYDQVWAIDDATRLELRKPDKSLIRGNNGGIISVDSQPDDRILNLPNINKWAPFTANFNIGLTANAQIAIITYKTNAELGKGYDGIHYSTIDILKYGCGNYTVQEV